MPIFKPCKIIDPITGDERILSAEEQEDMLEKGIILDVPCQPIESVNHPEDPQNNQNNV